MKAMTVVDNFVQTLSGLEYSPEEEFSVEGCEGIYKRRRFELTTLSQLPRYVGLYRREHVTLDDVSEISSRFYQEINLNLGNNLEDEYPKLKTTWEEVKGGTKLATVAVDIESKTTFETKIFWAIPVIFVENVDEDLVEVLAKITVDHYARMEFPVVVDVVNQVSHYYRGHKIFGGLYYWKLKREVAQFFPEFPAPTSGE